MNDWVVETPSFEEDLINNRYQILIKPGINKVVDIIKDKNKQIERFNNIINELDKILKEDVILRCCCNGKMQYNKTLTEGGLLYREYIINTLQNLRGDRL